GDKFKQSNKPILNNSGKLCIEIYTDEPFVYVACEDPSNSPHSDQMSNWKELQDANPDFSVIKENSVDYIPDTDVCILFPIAKVTYIGEAHKKFKSDFRNEKEFYDDYCIEYGHFFANKILVGGILIIRNFVNAKMDQVEYLKSHLAWAFYASRSINENPMEKVIIDDIPVIETTDGFIQSPKDLAAWMKSIYEDNVVEIISYEEVNPIFTIMDRRNINRFTKRLVPGITHKHKELTFKIWLNNTPSTNLLPWIDKFHFCNGVLVNQFGITNSKQCVMDFIKMPIITTHDCLHLQIIHPNTNTEETLLRNNIIYESNSIPFVDMVSSEVNDINYFFVRHEVFKISLESCIKPRPEFEQAVEVALNSIKPYHALQELFNEFGHLLPLTVTLGRQLRKISQKLKDSTNHIPFEISFKSLSQHDIDEAFKQINMNFEYLTESKGNIRKQGQIYDWLTEYKNDDNLLEIIRMDQVFPLYKILDNELQHRIDIILENRLNIRMLLTGFTTVNVDKIDFNEIHIRVNFGEHLNDDCFQVFGHVVDDDDKKLEDVIIKFDLFDYDGFSAFIILNQETAMNVEKLHVAWIIVGKPEIIDVVYISLPCIMSENDVVLLVASYDPPLNNPPATNIKMLKWAGRDLCLNITGIILDEEILKLTQL
ncbi:15969_t:CDS:2, partial [Gigaspora margarita]